MQLFVLAPGVRHRVVLVAFTSFTLASTTVFAQAPCTAPPPAPASAAASVTAPGNSANPAAVTVTWAGGPTTGANDASTYIVEVGNARGATNIAEIDTRSTRGSTVQTATNGTYYVRVRAANACGRSAPSPEPVVTVAGTIPAGEPAALIVWAFFSHTIEGFLYAAGEVRGSWGARPTGEIKIESTFLGADGQTLGTESTYAFGRARRQVSSRIIDDTTLASGESGCFVLFTEIPVANVAQAFGKTSWSLSQLEPLRGSVAVQGVVQDADASGNLVVRGQLRNAGPVPTYFNSVVIDFRDSENRVGWCDFELVQGSTVQLPTGKVTDTALAPGQVGSFVNYSPAPRAEVGGVNMWTAWEEADAAPTTQTTRLLSWQKLVHDVRAVPALDARGRARMRNLAIQRLQAIGDGGIPLAP